MIIWLPSYPRSGNTLTRTILKKCFDLDTYSDEPLGSILSGKSASAIGHKEFDGKWTAFYQEAKASREIFFIKTHLQPIDDSPFIYITRDGRAAAWSYYLFMRDFFPEARRSLLQIVTGDDYYGDWSTHYNAWMNRPNIRCLQIDFDQLSNSQPGFIQEFARFTNFNGEIQPWVNPMSELHMRDPNFFREGRLGWTAPVQWTPSIDFLFWHRHGQLMKILGHGTAPDWAITPEHREILLETDRVTAQLLNHNRLLHQVCIDRQTVIDELVDERNRQRSMTLSAS